MAWPRGGRFAAGELRGDKDRQPVCLGIMPSALHDVTLQLRKRKKKKNASSSVLSIDPDSLTSAHLQEHFLVMEETQLRDLTSHERKKGIFGSSSGT